MSSYTRTCLLSVIGSCSAPQVGPSITVTCTEGKWNKQVACEPVDCGVPDHHHVYAASFSCPEGTTFGRRCSFQCRHPAQLKGILSSLSQAGLHYLRKTQQLFPNLLLSLSHQEVDRVVSLSGFFLPFVVIETVLPCSQKFKRYKNLCVYTNGSEYPFKIL